MQAGISQKNIENYLPQKVSGDEQKLGNRRPAKYMKKNEPQQVSSRTQYAAEWKLAVPGKHRKLLATEGFWR